MSVDVDPIPVETLQEKAQKAIKAREERNKVWIEAYNNMAKEKGLPTWDQLLEKQKARVAAEAENAKRRKEREERARANGGNTNYVHCRKHCKDFKRCECWKRSFEDQILCYKQRAEARGVVV